MIGMNSPSIGRRPAAGLAAKYASAKSLINSLGGEFVGSDIDAENIRVGSRQSMMRDGADSTANELDRLLLGDIPVIGVSNGATNEVDTVITSWDKVQIDGTVVPTDNLDGSYNVHFNGTTAFGLAIRSNFTPIASTVYTGNIEIKLVSGDSANLEVQLFQSGGFTDSDTLSTLTNEWSSFQPTGTTVGTTVTQFRILNTAAVSNCTIAIRRPRVIKSSVSHPAYLAGTTAGETYGTDLVSCTPTWGSEGTIMQGIIGYGSGNFTFLPVGSLWSWSTTNQFGGYIDFATNKNKYFGSSISPIVPESDPNIITRDSIVVSAYDWNGATIGLRTNSFSRTSAAETDIPSGALYLNNDLATRPFHGILITVVFPSVLSDAEYATVRALLEEILNGVELK